MTKDDFVALCKELLPLGAIDISGGVFRAQFRRPEQAPRERAPDEKPQRPPTPDEQRHAHYARVMGEQK